MLQKLQDVEKRFDELERQLVDPAVIGNQDAYRGIAKQHSDLQPVIAAYREWMAVSEEIEGHKELLAADDDELSELAKAELPGLQARLSAIEADLQKLLLPKDPNDERNVLLEIRAGTGGDEAGLFASQLFRAYTRFAETQGWRVEIMSAHETGVGGMKEAIALITGRGAYSRLKFEGGVHRVQRVPVTEASGRIHTSTVTVAIMPEADDVDVQIDEANDLRIDVYRSSGPGGQSVNTTDSAVRVTHLPTGLVVSCQDEKSQHKNKAKGLKILRSRLLERAQAEQHAELSENRRSMVGSGERSERIRTYNFPQGRMTDHRINLTLYSLDRIMEGDLEAVIDALGAHYQAEALKASE